MKTTILYNPECSKCQYALKTLEESGENIEVIDYLQSTPSEQALRDILKKLGLPAEDIVRKKEALYQEKFADKIYSEDEWITILVQNPTLIERPIIIKGDKAVIGRSAETLADIVSCDL